MVVELSVFDSVGSGVGTGTSGDSLTQAQLSPQLHGDPFVIPASQQQSDFVGETWQHPLTGNGSSQHVE